MKKLIIILALLAGPALLPAQTANPKPADFQRNLQEIVKETAHFDPNAKPEPLTKFNLDFKGGTPEDLVKAIEKALGKHLNVMIPANSKAGAVCFTPLKLERVDVAQLFKAIGEANRKTAKNITGTGGPFGGGQQYSEYIVEYGFRPSNAAPLTDDTIWYFYNTERDPLPDAGNASHITCGYFQLETYLQSTTIDAITTAINTSFELLSENPPKMKFHPDTQLLIVAGTPDQLQNISNLLKLLPGHSAPGKARRAASTTLPPQAPPNFPATRPFEPTATPVPPIEPVNQ